MDNYFQELKEQLNRIEGMLMEIRRRQASINAPEPALDLPMTAAQAAEFLHISKGAIYQKLEKIPHRKRGKRLYFFKQELFEYLRSGTV